MDKLQQPSAPEANYPQGGYSQPQYGYPQSGYPEESYQQEELPPQQTGYSQSSYAQQGIPPPPPHGGYPGFATQSGYQPPLGYTPQHQPGHQPNSEHQPLSTAQPVYGTVHVTAVPPRYTWWEDMRRNIPQAKSLSAATLIFASGGMSLAWSIGFTPNYGPANETSPMHVQICWFIAVIIGASISAVLNSKVTHRAFNLIASTLVLANGVLFISAGQTGTVVIIARYCDGIAFGLTLISSIVVGSEQSTKRYRGYVLSTEQLGLIAGMHLFLIISISSLTHGILAVVFGGLALALTFIYTIDSPVAYLRKGNETEAINALRQLQRPYVITAETYDLLLESKHLLQEDVARGRSTNVSNGLIPIVNLCMFRAVVSMSLSLPLAWGFIIASVLTNPVDVEKRFYIFATMRLIGVIFALYVLDTAGRKKVSATALLIGGGLVIGVGSLFSNNANQMDLEPMNTARGLLIAYQVFAGLAAPVSTCYLGEAFSISVKPYFILIAVVFENIIQIIICSTFNGSVASISGYGYSLGILQIVFGIYFIFGMPETKNTTLREALEKFTKVTNVEERI